MQAVNRNVHTKSEIGPGAHVRKYQRPATLYQRVPDLPTMPSVAGEHGPAATSLPQAAPGTCGGSPRGRSRAPLRRPRERRKRGDRAAALCCAGGGRRFLRTSPELAEPPASPAAAGTRAQRPGATSTVLPATAAATSAVLGGGGAAAFWRPQRLRSAANRTL